MKAEKGKGGKGKGTVGRGRPPAEYQFKKGQSGNPLGGKLHNPELRAIKKLTAIEVAEVGSLLLDGNLAALKAVAKDPNATVLKVMIASVAVRTISKGDYGALDTILNRLVGKVPNTVAVTKEKNPFKEYLDMSEEERAALFKETLEELRATENE